MSGGYTGGPSVPRSWIVSHVKSSTLQKPAVEPTRVRLGSPWILDGSNPEEKSWEVHGCEIEAGPRRLSSSRCRKGKPHGKTRPPKQKRTTTSTPEPSGCCARTAHVTYAGSSHVLLRESPPGLYPEISKETKIRFSDQAESNVNNFESPFVEKSAFCK